MLWADKFIATETFLKGRLTSSPSFAVLLSIEVVLAACCGWIVESESWVITMLLILAQIPVIALILFAGEVKFGSAGTTWKQDALDLAFGGLMAAAGNLLSVLPDLQLPQNMKRVITMTTKR